MGRHQGRHAKAAARPTAPSRRSTGSISRPTRTAGCAPPSPGPRSRCGARRAAPSTPTSRPGTDPVARSTSVFDYRGRFGFDVPPDAIWSSIEHAERFESWWAWLREFRLDGPGLVEGSVLTGVVSPPVPYTMRIRVVLGDCARPEHIDATVHGDLEGEARLVLVATDLGTVAEVSWTV